jgi:4-hydroxy-2-oxoglutarate aldolase
MEQTLPSGIYPPLPTFFDEHDELDLPTLRRHIQRLADSGIAGYVLMGTNGEAVHLSSAERARVIQAARETIGTDSSMPLVVGCGDQSTRATIAHCEQAARCGADFVLVLPPSYYKARMDPHALKAHYRAVADASPLPLLIYNMPASAGGLDLDTATICTLATHPKIVGVKDSAGNLTKLARIVSSVPSDFHVFAGNAGFLLAALSVGAVGAVSALANVFPHEVCDVQALFEAGELEDARALQASLLEANAAVTTMYSVSGLKAALELTAGYGGNPRLPLQPLTVQERNRLVEILKGVQAVSS